MAKPFGEKPFALLMATVAALFLFASCSSKAGSAEEELAGNWIILYPDHKLTTLHQREVYGHYQDSIISLYGLKLLTLSADGGFREMDSLHRPPGKWLFTQDSLLRIREAGKGFNPFNAQYKALQNGELQLTQYLPLEDEKIKLVWHLKKMADDSVAKLFSEEGNAWRKKPALPETEPVMQKRLAAMLNYYGDYYALVQKEASYFSPARVPLPFRYYQHGAGLKTDLPPSFTRLFFNEQQAAQARGLLERAMNESDNGFPQAENFVAEYGLFFKKLSAQLSKTAGR